jgi:hypothetical protein
MQQLNRLIEFRQDVYQHAFPKARDAQFELVDSLLVSPPVRSFAELSCASVFRRRWPSVYAAIEEGEINTTWVEERLYQEIDPTPVIICPVDGSSWPHPQAKTLEDRQYVHQASDAVDGGEIVVGHTYSVLAWTAEVGTSWALPVAVQRVLSTQTEGQVGATQAQRLSRWWQQHRPGRLVIVADGRYGNQPFLGALTGEACAVVVRLRQDRVLYGEPGPYPGHGRPAKHGPRFAFRDPATWPEPAATVELTDPEWGQVRLRRWDNLHARQAATLRCSVLRVETHREREHPPSPLWLGYQPAAGDTPETFSVETVWRWYPWRWPIEPGMHFRKAELHWTAPMFQAAARCDRWSWLVSFAQWQLYLSRELVADRPLPWQPKQERLTPERVRQGWPEFFSQVGTPAQAPRTRGKSPGWPKGRARTRPERHPVVKKQRKNTKK